MILLVEILLQLLLGQLVKLTTMLDIGAIIYARFICATILHLTLIEELHSALNNMKYVLNHQYIFEQPKVAFMVTFLHFVCTFMTETTNIFVILMGPIKIAHDRIRTKDLLVVFNKRTDYVPCS